MHLCLAAKQIAARTTVTGALTTVTLALSAMAEQAPLDVIEKCLNHTGGKQTSCGAIRDMRDAWQLWGEDSLTYCQNPSLKTS
jgi:hypothetical protein